VLSSLLTAFRQQHPTGSLVSELLTIHHEQYLVRVSVMIDGHTLSTGLAAHKTVETAEDLACIRALERSGLSVQNQAAQIQTAPLASDSAPSALELQSHDSPVQEKTILAHEPTPPPNTIATSVAPSVTAMPQVAVPSPEESPRSPTPLTLATPPAAQTSSSSAPDLAPPKQPTADQLPPPPMPSLSIEAAAPVDLSDIIAQTDVELQRLGWDVSQGREFLEKTYGKRSRHDLTDEELLEFLLYLEAQPAPSHP